ncbi:MAG: hypothetical protein KDA41_20295 [Planctomycetales bacterium]|nr:hypothetical protein [Planctomycetales bacterium]
MTTENPPREQEVITRHSFVPQERNTQDEAWDFAVQQASIKHPGMVDAIVLLESLMDQYRSGKGLPPRKR